MTAAIDGTERGLRVGEPAPAPLAPRSEDDITARWSGGPPLVSLLCLTYQHVDFIDDAMRGLLGQRTDFAFEVIVRDDASTDGTADIVREYARRFPGIVRAILEPVNTFSSVNPLLPLRAAATGTYIAICEGDDYWIADDKLQRQVDVLRARPGLALAADFGVVVRDGIIVGLPPASAWTELSESELRRADGAGIREICLRADAWPDWDLTDRVPGLDKFLLNGLGLHGGATRIPGLFGTVYRLHSGGVWSQLPEDDRAISLATTHYWIGVFFDQRGDRDAAAHHLARASEVLQRSRLMRGVDPRGRLLRSLLRAAPGMLARGAQRRLTSAVRGRSSHAP